MSFDPSTIAAVWRKGQTDQANNPAIWRKDACGAWIAFGDYGNRNSPYGWEIDHITPESHGGSDRIDNLRPLNWRNNAAKSDGRLRCVVTAHGVDNGLA